MRNRFGCRIGFVGMVLTAAMFCGGCSRRTPPAAKPATPTVRVEFLPPLLQGSGADRPITASLHDSIAIAAGPLISRVAVKQKTEPMRFELHAGNIQQLHRSGDGRRLASVSGTGTVRIFDIDVETPLVSHPDDRPVSIRGQAPRCRVSPSGTLLHCADCVENKRALCPYSRVRSFELASGRLIGQVSLDAPLRDFMPLLDDGLALLASGELPIFFDARSGKKLSRVPAVSPPPEFPPGVVIPPAPLVPRRFSGSECVLDTASTTEEALLMTQLSPDGSRLVYLQTQPVPRLCVFAARTRTLENTIVPTIDTPITYWPDREPPDLKLVALTKDGRGALLDAHWYRSNLVLLDTGTGAVVDTLPEGEVIQRLDDGSLLVSSGRWVRDFVNRTDYVEAQKILRIDSELAITPFPHPRTKDYAESPIAVRGDGRVALYPTRRQHSEYSDGLDSLLGAAYAPPRRSPSKPLLLAMDSPNQKPALSTKKLSLHPYFEYRELYAFIDESLIYATSDYALEVHSIKDPDRMFEIDPPRLSLSQVDFTTCGLTLHGYDHKHQCLGVEPDTTTLQDRQVKDQPTEEHKTTIEQSTIDRSTGDSCSVMAGGTQRVCRMDDHTLTRTDLATGKRLADIELPKGTQLVDYLLISTLSFVPFIYTVSPATEHSLLVYDLVTGVAHPAGPVRHYSINFSVSRDGSYVYAFADPQMLLVVDTKTWKTKRFAIPLSEEPTLLLPRDHFQTAIIGTEHGAFVFQDLRDGRILARLTLDRDSEGRLGGVATDAENHLLVLGELEDPWRFAGCRLGARQLSWKECYAQRQDPALAKLLHSLTSLPPELASPTRNADTLQK